MNFGNRKLIAPAVFTLCLIAFAAWKLHDRDGLDGDSDAEAKIPTRAQSIDIDKSNGGAVTLAGATLNDPSPVRTSPYANDAAETLNDQVQRAFAAKHGVMAVDLANKLKECEINLKVMEVEGSQGGHPNADAAVQAVRIQRLQDYQRIIASCQTIPGNRHQVRLDLLNLAIEQGVLGAATEIFESGSRDPAVLQHVVNDARSGDVKALANVAMYGPKVFNISRDEQDAARYGLKSAAMDPEVGGKAAIYLRIAESYSLTDSGFDLSAISDVAQAQGAEIAERLKVRLRKQTN